MVIKPLAFLVSSSSRERRALAASMLGWMLDGMDVTLYAMVIRELLRELQLTTAQAGLLASVTLVASAVGGILFGLVADRFGRRPALIISIVVYSVFTAACGLSHGLWELAALRLGVGLGMGGEWATGAALVSETWPDQHRGKAMGLMQSGFAIGYALAAVLAALIMPRWGWRPVFFAGILPALLTLWIGSRVEESPLWLADHGIRGSGLGVRNLESGIQELAQRIQDSEFGIPDAESESRIPNPHSLTPNPVSRSVPRYAKAIIVTLLMNSAALFGWWGLFTWIPSYLALPIDRGGRGLSLAASSAWIIAMQAGMWLGYVTFGFISDAVGRKRTYVCYLFIAALLVPLYARSHPLALLVVGPLLAFFGTGHFTGFGIITAELFPTSFRASAMGLTYNFGRALSAAAPWAIGVIATRGGLASAFGISGLAFLLAGVLALALPETRGRSLASPMIQEEPIVDKCNQMGVTFQIRQAIRRGNWKAIGPKLLGTICVFILGGILVAGLWPFHAPENQVTWLAGGNGLRFGSHGTILSAGKFKAADAQDDAPCSFEIWLEPKVTAASGTLFAFYAPESPRQFLLYQSISDLALRIDVEDESHKTRIIRLYVDDIFRRGKRLFITVTSNGVQTSVYVDGVLARTGREFPLSVHDFEGELIIANSPRTDNSWSGELRGLAFYHQNLTPAQVHQHFVTWTTKGRPETSENERPVALYLFDERTGGVIHNEVSSGTSLYIPNRYLVLDQAFLSPFWKGFEPTWSYGQDVLVNIVGFVPFGFLFCAYFSLADRFKRPALATILLGLVVSLTIESLQVYLPTRDSDSTDVITNVVGTCLGVWLYRSNLWQGPMARIWASLNSSGQTSAEGPSR